jgi:hypothetical protein
MRLRWASILLVCAGAACEHHPAAPQPGTLTVRLQNPNDGLDGAIMFTLTGPAAPTSPAAVAGDTLWGGPHSSTTNRIVLTGGIRSGVILTFGVPDVNTVAQYTATANQVAASGAYALRALSGYTLTVTK